ncbi:PREDICTED: uncharacterized protein LOC101370521 [Odobenus rosmarus divergens]|uniref:Uncharacterized protein LOC101370521 n=1 Tax=Odobenus rosmarus divergens TaxID=9708 RepID=A0A9B0GS55_ODORO
MPGPIWKPGYNLPTPCPPVNLRSLPKVKCRICCGSHIILSQGQGTTDFTSKCVAGYFQGGQSLHSTLTQGSLSLAGRACLEHHLIPWSPGFRGGYKSVDLGDQNQRHLSHQNKDGVETRPARGHRRDFQQPASNSLAAIPSSGSLVASHDYYWCRLGSPSSNSSCRSAEYAGEAIPHHPSLPKADPGHWWASFFFGKSTLPYSAAVLESPESLASSQASSSRILWDLALEAMRKQRGGQPAKPTWGPHPERPPPIPPPPAFRRHWAHQNPSPPLPLD